MMGDSLATTQKSFVITIDGPAGSGKSTVSAILATKLRYTFLTTGAFYRGLALLTQKRQAALNDPEGLAQLAKDPGFKVTANENGTLVFIDGEDVTATLNSEKVAAVASQISSISAVRQALLGPQRAF